MSFPSIGLTRGTLGTTRRYLLRRLDQSRIRRWLYADRYLTIYRMNLPAESELVPSACNVNCWRDLRRFQQTERWLPRHKFLDEARDRIDQGLLVFTLSDGYRLFGYAWLNPYQEHGYFPYVRQSYEYPSGAAVLFGAWVHPDVRGRGLHQSLSRSRLTYASRLPGMRYAYTAVEDHNSVSHFVIRKLGFTPMEELYEWVRLGRAARGSRVPDSHGTKAVLRVSS